MSWSILLVLVKTSPELLEDVVVDSLNFSEGWLVQTFLLFNVNDYRVYRILGLFQSRHCSWSIGRGRAILGGLVASMWFIESWEGHGPVFPVGPLLLVVARCLGPAVIIFFNFLWKVILALIGGLSNIVSGLIPRLTYFDIFWLYCGGFNFLALFQGRFWP